MAESSLYERLGGAFAIAAVIDHFSDAVVRNPIAGQQSRFVTGSTGACLDQLWVR
jgi:hemoglobin